MEGRNVCYRRPQASGASSSTSTNWGGFVSPGRYGSVHNNGTNALHADGHCDWRRELQCTAGMFLLSPDDRNSAYTHHIVW